MSKFQFALLAIFGFFIIVAVLVFSMVRGGGALSAQVTIWGPIGTPDWGTIENAAGLHQNRNLQITYIEKSLEDFDVEFTEAIATGKGPDLVILPLEKLWKNKNKLILIPEANLNRCDYIGTFIEEGEMFLDAGGTYAIPLYVDPLVLYYNRDLFTKASLVKPPAFWDEIYGYAEKLTERDGVGNIVKTTIPLGEARNIPHAKDILSLLFLQAGAPITTYDGLDLRPALFDNPLNLSVIPGEAALDFYTQFSNPLKSFYSWNRSLPSAETSFISGDAAMYIGFASEWRDLRAKNPNLNLGVASVPQSAVSGRALTYGNIYGIALARSAEDPGSALSAALVISSTQVSKAIGDTLVLPSARRDILGEKPPYPEMGVFYTAAIQSKGWIDPNSDESRSIFHRMIDGVTSGRTRTTEAVGNANQELGSIVK